jgi:hypothetical protein
MSFYLFAGLFTGMSIPFMISTKNYLILFDGLYKPHLEHRAVKEIRAQKGQLPNEGDYLKYVLNTFGSFGWMLYEFAYGDRYKFKIIRQTAGLILTAQFEYINETISNYEHISQRVSTLVPITSMSYEVLDSIEKSYVRQESLEEINIQNIAIMKSQAKDDFEKYTLDNSIIKNEEYQKQQNPEIRLEEEKNNIKSALLYQQAVEQFESHRRRDDIFRDIRDVDPKIINEEEVFSGKKKYENKTEKIKKLEDQVLQVKEFIEQNKS